MVSATERFTAAAGHLGVRAAVRRFPQGTRTAADAARAVDCDIGQIVKSLVLVADGRAFLALTSGPNRADTDALGALLGAEEVRRATPDEARAAGLRDRGHPSVRAVRAAGGEVADFKEVVG